MLRVSVYVPRMGVMEAICPAYRIFNTANDFLKIEGKDPLFQVDYVGLDEQTRLGEGQYVVNASVLLKDLVNTDLLIIPAIFGDMDEAIAANQEALPLIAALYHRGTELASLCLGAFLMAASGVLKHRRCSTHWAYYEQFRRMFEDVEIVDGAIITDDGRLYSSGGANSIWNLLIYLVEKHAGREIAILLAKYFAIDIDRNTQSQFTIFSGQKKHADDGIFSIQKYIERNVDERFCIDSLARELSISRRSFERRFKLATNNSVLEYIQRTKIEAAKRSFENSRKNVNEVMYDVGYNDTKAFRMIFKKLTGLTPLEYKNKYNRNSHVA